MSEEAKTPPTRPRPPAGESGDEQDVPPQNYPKDKARQSFEVFDTPQKKVGFLILVGVLFIIGLFLLVTQARILSGS